MVKMKILVDPPNMVSDHEESSTGYYTESSGHNSVKNLENKGSK
jgi:hypothetical protein